MTNTFEALPLKVEVLPTFEPLERTTSSLSLGLPLGQRLAEGKAHQGAAVAREADVGTCRAPHSSLVHSAQSPESHAALTLESKSKVAKPQPLSEDSGPAPGWRNT